MAGLVSRSQTQPPKEEDLQDLYNAVLAGFSEETPTDLHNPYSPAEDTPQSSIPTKRFGGDAASDVLPSYPVNQQSRSFPAEKADSITSPSSSQGRPASSRPLPQTPPVSGPSQFKTPQTPVVAFPEAQPYKPVPKIIPPPPPPPLPPHLNRHDDSGVTSNGMQFEPWRPSTSPNTRRLPQAPADDFSSHPYRASGLPANPRAGFTPSAGKSSLSQYDAGPSVSDRTIRKLASAY
ncbi:hypothetical protein BD410DRAFT_146741 [Rickenella mellea]|uniref:Uncharacterized protein n=1 Tax=Rickenella mellea TaxID=50990 RepID=A0A4Y7Q9C9_9AGAM|nr:hypothetical protein BD410DRAFT_146741 [Rickenella mellea]